MRLRGALIFCALLAVPALMIGLLRPHSSAGDAAPARPHLSPAHEQVLAVGFTAKGDLLSVGSEGTLAEWDARTGRILSRRRLGLPDARLAAAQFSRPAREVAVMGLDGVARVWDCRTHACLLQLRHADSATFGFAALAIAANGSSVAVVPDVGRAGVWDMEGRRLLDVAADGLDPARVAVSPDGSRLALGGGRPIEIWDLRTRRPAVGVDSPAPVAAIAWSPDSRLLVTAPGPARPGASPGMMVLDGRDGRGVRRLPAMNTAGAEALVFSPDGRRLAAAVGAFTAAGAPRGTVRATWLPQVWDLQTGARRFNLSRAAPQPGHLLAATCLDWSGDARRIATGGLDGRVLVWDSTTGRLLCEAHG